MRWAGTDEPDDLSIVWKLMWQVAAATKVGPTVLSHDATLCQQLPRGTQVFQVSCGAVDSSSACPEHFGMSS